jgi:type II secretory pathway pseudopilin PulG
MKTSFRNRYRQQGYILVVLLLFVALLSIGLLATVERIDFEIKRDREEELIHRGVQYSRAIRRFIKTVGRYPVSVEELEGKNDIRFLRRRYKDPITGKDFHFLHMEDVAYMSAPALKPSIKGATLQTPLQQIAGGPDTSGPNTGSDGDESSRREEANQVRDPSVPDPEGDGSDKPTVPEEKPDESLNVSPIVGVASISNGQTIREFHGQNRYNQWLFIYNPSTDRNGILTSPDQPKLNRTAQNGAQGSGQQTEQAATLKDPGSEQPNPQ